MLIIVHDAVIYILFMLATMLKFSELLVSNDTLMTVLLSY